MILVMSHGTVTILDVVRSTINLCDVSGHTSATIKANILSAWFEIDGDIIVQTVLRIFGKLTRKTSPSRRTITALLEIGSVIDTPATSATIDTK
jgi:hypothetical protein